MSMPISIDLPSSATPALTLAQVVPPPADPLAGRPDVVSALKPLDFVSPVLTQFWGRDIHIRGWVLLPPGYESHPTEKYPTVYFTHGFGGTLPGLRARYAPILYDRMKQGKMPEMIWVLLDESSPTGTHEFADGVNNGPWGKALTTELIPHIEAEYPVWTRARRGGSCRGIPLGDGRRSGCRPTIQRSSEAHGQPRPIRATFIFSAPSICTRRMGISIATSAVPRHQSFAITAKLAQRWSNLPDWNRCSEITAGRLAHSSGFFRREDPMAARSTFSIG